LGGKSFRDRKAKIKLNIIDIAEKGFSPLTLW
jgi:hypothetical protein